MFTRFYFILLVHKIYNMLTDILQKPERVSAHEMFLSSMDFMYKKILYLVFIFSQMITLLKKNDRKWKLMSVDEQLRLERMVDRKNAFLDGIPEGEDVDFNVSVFRNTTVEHVLMENSRYGIHNVYRT